MPAKLTKTDEALELDLSNCRGSEFQDALTKIKSIPGRRFDGTRKLWLLPADALTAERVIQTLEPEAPLEIHEWIRASRVKEAAELTTPLPPDAKLLLGWAGAEGFVPDEKKLKERLGLYPYQRAAVALMAKTGQVILADDMGLGKTTSAIATIEEWRLRNGQPDGPRLVVCPNSVKGVWAAEINAWVPDDEVFIVKGTTPKARENQLIEAIQANAWAVVNYEQLRVKKEKKKLRNGGTKTVTVMKQPLFEKTDWLAVVADEVHRAKNRKAAQTMGLFRTRGSVMIGASGTPLMNSPDELWSILHWLFPKEYTSYWAFYENYVDYYETRFGKEVIGVKNPDALRFELKDRLIRRTKDDELNLPDKIREYVPVELTTEQEKAYAKAEDDLWLDLEKTLQEARGPEAAKVLAAEDPVAAMVEIANGAVRTVRLRQVLEAAKLGTAVELVLDAQKQVSIFVEFVESAKQLVELLRAKGLRAEFYIGEVKPEERTALEARFQAGTIDVLVGTMAAMGEGVTLHSSDTSVHVTRNWNPARNEQAEDRHHRIGQTRPVTILIIQVPDTVDTKKVLPSNRRKEKMTRTVLKKDPIKEITRG